MPELTDRIRTAAGPRPAPPDLARVDRRVRTRRRHRRSVVAGAAVLVLVALATVVVATRGGDPESQQVVTGPDGRTLTEPVGMWRQAADPPFAAREAAFTATTGDGRILVWGGGGMGGPGGIQLDGGVYDPDADEWEAIPAAPLAPTGFFTRASLAGGRLAVVGVSNSGDTGQESAAVYDLSGGEWTATPDLPFGAGDSMAWDGETLVLLSLGGSLGVEGAGDEPRTIRWRVGEDEWTDGAPFPLGSRTVPAIATSSEAIAVWGGTTSDLSGARPLEGTDGGATADGAVYDVAEDRWVEMAPGPLDPRVNAAAIWQDDEVVIGGGQTGFDGTAPSPAPIVAAYDPAQGTWRELAPPPLDEIPSDRLDAPPGTPPEFILDRTDGPAITIEGYAGTSGPQPRWFTLGDDWEEAPLYDLHELDLGLVATSATRDNPDDGPFEVTVRAAPGVWLDGVDGPFTNRMEPAVGAAGDRLLVVGGLEGRDLEPVGDAWVYDASG